LRFWYHRVGLYIDVVLLQVHVVRFRDLLGCSTSMSWVMMSKVVSYFVLVVLCQQVSRCLCTVYCICVLIFM